MKAIHLCTTLLLFKLFLFSTTVYPQSIQENFLDKDCIIKLNKQIRKIYKRSECYNDSLLYKIVSIYDVAYDGELNKQDFINKTFLNNIRPVYFKKGFRKFLNNQSYIYNAKGDLIARTDGIVVDCSNNYNPSILHKDKLLIEKIVENEIVIAFYIGLTPLGTYFAINESKNIFLIKTYSDNVEIYELPEYIKDHWVNLF
jgi:hypothetical protein